jgi:methionyl aminopeptidase
MENFEGMRAAGKLAAEVLDFITPYIIPGVTTEKLDQLCHDYIISHNAIPAPLNYKGFPKSVCTSVNHVVCHGIPSQKILSNGDIMNLDVTVILDGWYGDTSRMYYIGDKVSPKAKRLCQVTYDSMMLGIEQVRDGARLNQIGKAIQTYAEKQGFSVVMDFCGHGIGKTFHTDPSILHFYDPDCDIIMQEGMMFTIEPMINAGTYQVKILGDGWTAVTRDRSLSAQFEHTLGVTKNGCEIFTVSPKGMHFPPY